ncbi:MAG: ImmA/IrrE family metallo-endopeptidase, partial [Microcoleus sp.]
MWSSSERTIYNPTIRTEAALWAFMHEIAHALLDHRQFKTDIELVTKEAEAWEYAATNLAPRYEQKIPSHYIEKQLNTYRDWLHLRSLCPTCGQTGIQTQANRYSCINCNGSWSVNDARR